MRKLVERALENLSTKDVFLFRVICSSCGEEYGKRPIRFSKAGEESNTQNSMILRDVLYEQEFRTAMQVAVRNASEQMNYCPVCKSLICNRCFMICEDLDLCVRCASLLQQRGQPVSLPLPEGS